MESLYLKAKDVAAICNVGLSQAYKIINAANDQAAKEGKYVINHRVSRQFLFKFLGIN